MNTAANTPETLRRRAQLAVQAAASAVVAKAHIEKALLNARHGRLDMAVMKDLHGCLAAIDRTVRHAEQCRGRFLRKADRTTNLLPIED